MKAWRGWALMTALVMTALLSGCSFISNMINPSSGAGSGFDISNPKNLAWMCARSDESVDWQACFAQVNQVCGDKNHAVRIGLYGPLHTSQPFYNGYYITFQCDEGYSDGEPLHLVDPVTGAAVDLQTPPPPEAQPDLGFGDNTGSAPPAATPPSTPPAATPPAVTPPAATPPATPPAATPPGTPPANPQPPAKKKKPPAGSTPPSQGKPAPVTIISS